MGRIPWTFPLTSRKGGTLMTKPNLPTELQQHLSAGYHLREEIALDPHTGTSMSEAASTFYELISSGFTHLFGFSSCSLPPQLHCVRSFNRKCARVETPAGTYIIVDLQILLDMERLTKILLFARGEEPSVAFAFLYL